MLVQVFASIFFQLFTIWYRFVPYIITLNFTLRFFNGISLRPDAYELSVESVYLLVGIAPVSAVAV